MTKPHKDAIIFYVHRGVEQLAARWAHNPKVGGSSPPPATTNFKASNLYITCSFLFFLTFTSKNVITIIIFINVLSYFKLKNHKFSQISLILGVDLYRNN